MKKHFFYLSLLLSFSGSFSQSWQWGKRGGSANQLYVNYTTETRAEEAYSIVTDSQKNIYMLSRVGDSNLNFDGVPDIIYEVGQADKALVSFSCDGTFRWSKIIGGSGEEEFLNLQIDSQDNIYLAGRFGNISAIGYGQQYIDDEVAIPAVPSDYRRLVILKYNSSGQLQWYQRPEPNLESLSSRSRSFQIDADGNLYWLVYLGATGTYADGALTVTDITKPWHVLKYDSSGSYVGATNLNLQTTNQTIAVQFFRNPYNENLFITARTVSNNGSVWATVGTEEVTHSMFIACFDPSGQAVWKRENASSIVGTIQLYNLLFDTDNSIYLGGRFAEFSTDTFMGLTIPEVIIPGFLMKIDAMASAPIWSTYHNRGAFGQGALVMKGDELGFTDYCSGTNFAWGTQTLNATGTNQGNDVLFARLNKNSGACLSLTKIPGNIGYDDYGCALAVDVSGDYILGGNFSGTLTFDGGVQITNNGGQSDFFIAKYATQSCSPLSVAQNTFENLTHYPNPTTGILNIESDGVLAYELYDFKGSLVAKGVTSAVKSNIDLSGYKTGTYILKMKHENGAVSSLKVVKN